MTKCQAGFAIKCMGVVFTLVRLIVQETRKTKQSVHHHSLCKFFHNAEVISLANALQHQCKVMWRCYACLPRVAEVSSCQQGYSAARHPMAKISQPTSFRLQGLPDLCLEGWPYAQNIAHDRYCCRLVKHQAVTSCYKLLVKHQAVASHCRASVGQGALLGHTQILSICGAVTLCSTPVILVRIKAATATSARPPARQTFIYRAQFSRV